jgi:hypothetical protein
MTVLGDVDGDDPGDFLPIRLDCNCGGSVGKRPTSDTTPLTRLEGFGCLKGVGRGRGMRGGRTTLEHGHLFAPASRGPVHTRPFTTRCYWGGVERVDLVLADGWATSGFEVGSFEGSRHLLICLALFVHGHFRLRIHRGRCFLQPPRLRIPGRRQALFALWQLLESGHIVAEPEVKLEVFGRAFDVEEKVHELAGRAGLRCGSVKSHSTCDPSLA